MHDAASPRRLLGAPLLASIATALLACSAERASPAAAAVDPAASLASRDGGQGCIRGDPRLITVRSLGPGVAFGVNRSGWIAGQRFTRASDGPAVLWKPDGSAVDLGALAIGGSGVAFDVDDLGTAAGVSTFSSYVFPFHAFVWTESGGMRDLGAPGGTNSRARAVNGLGQIVGDVEGDGPDAAMLWEPDGTTMNLGTLGGPSSGANDVNDAGQVVGWSHVPNDGGGHAFLWTQAAGMRDLGTLGGRWSTATGVNGLGHVTGWSITADGRTHPFLWQPDTGMIDLDPQARGDAMAEAVNDRDEVVGYHYPAGTATAFYWSARTGIVELGTLGGAFSRAWDLNESGVVVGDSSDGITPELATVWNLGCAPSDDGSGDGASEGGEGESGDDQGRARRRPAADPERRPRHVPRAPR